MKKITIVFFIFINTFCYSQECLSDLYLQKIKNKNPLLEKKIKTIISGFERKGTSKIASTLEVPGEEIVVIPVVFNIIHSGESVGTGKNISTEKIDELMTILNHAYSGQFGGIDTKIKFCLAKQNSIGQATTGVNRFFGNSAYDLYDINDEFSLAVDKQIKSNIAPGFPNNLFLNIWVADLTMNGFNTLRAYSSFPFALEDNPATSFDETITNGLLDGIVLDYLQVGVTIRFPADNNSSDGSSAVHEVGHWLGLFHVFEDEDGIPCNETSCQSQGDMICDTDAVAVDGTGNIAQGNCLGINCVPTVFNGTISYKTITDVVQNYMDYQGPTRLHCRTKFTAGQKKRMKDILSFYRPSIFNQGLIFNLTICKPTSYGGGGGGCTEDATLPTQRISQPTIYQDLSNYVGTSIKFGERLEVNDKWIVTTYDTTGYILVGDPKPTLPVLDYILIYKREGCRYALYQSIELPFNNTNQVSDFGLILNGNEIIFSSAVKDEVYILRLNESNNSWGIAQQIKNTSASEVGTSTYTIGRFLFILERNTNADNILRVYYKNDSGIYVFHQNIAVSGFNMPSLGKYLQSANFSKNIVNFNSGTYVGSYDPPELLVSKSSGTGFATFALNSNNMWTLVNTSQPMGLSTSERTLDIEISKDFIHILTSEQTGVDGSLDDRMNLYSYQFTDRHGTTFPFKYSYNKQELLYNTDGILSDIKLQIFNDQFLFVDKMKGQPMKLYYNSNFGSTTFPNWQKKDSKKITCAGSILNSDDFEVFDNLLFYGYAGSTINIYNMSDILSREGFDTTFINNTDFYNKKINFVPENYSTSAQQITIGESANVSFNYVDKEFVANTKIVLKPGTTISRGSKVKLKITDTYGLCNSIVTSKKDNSKLDFEDVEYVNEIENEKTLELINKVVLYPNPNSGVFTLYMSPNQSKLHYEIYDNVGKLLYFGDTEKSTLDISLPNLPTGIYMVKLKGNNYKETIKFIKQ
jgi:hypothetical protein